jgi:eukaryotic-like serine/threonine-protein kinase
MPNELRAIAIKALAHERDARYDSAAAMADDLRRWLRAEPVLAMPRSKRYILRCFVRRNALASVAASLIAVALVGGIVVALYGLREAQAGRAEAEDMLGFMLGDLRKSLTEVGRLDLLRSVDDKATAYFAKFDSNDLSDRALEEQTRLLTGIGEVRLNEGNHKEAMNAFSEAQARAAALHERQPKNGQRLFDLAQVEFWIGNVALQQGKFADAELWLTRYRDSGIRLDGMNKNNFAWQRELAYGAQTLAALDESRGRYDLAEKGMLRLTLKI